jgi:hypothetical protein
MQRETIHDAWVPVDGVWSRWAKPVLFAQMKIATESISWLPAATGKIMLIVDLPGDAAVHFGLAVAARGYRPVPMFNACTAAAEFIDQQPIARALQTGAASLAALALPANAPPAFLLDSRRRNTPPVVRSGMLDNRWEVFPDDFPSAQAMRQRGVSQVLLIQSTHGQPKPDVARVLRAWHEDQIELQAKDITTDDPPQQLIMRPIPWFVRWLFGWRGRALSEDSRLSGFGYVVYQSSSG